MKSIALLTILILSSSSPTLAFYSISNDVSKTEHSVKCNFIKRHAGLRHHSQEASGFYVASLQTSGLSYEQAVDSLNDVKVAIAGMSDSQKRNELTQCQSPN